MYLRAKKLDYFEPSCSYVIKINELVDIVNCLYYALMPEQKGRFKALREELDLKQYEQDYVNKKGESSPTLPIHHD